MNLDSLSFTLSQISYLVANLNKKNFRESAKEISIVSKSSPFINHTHTNARKCLSLSLTHIHSILYLFPFTHPHLFPVCIRQAVTYPTNAICLLSIFYYSPLDFCDPLLTKLQRYPFILTFPVNLTLFITIGTHTRGHATHDMLKIFILR